jgi:hypothetical protein
LSRSGADADWDPEDIFRAALEDRLALWALVFPTDTVAGALATRVVEYPKRKVLEILAFGTNHDDVWAPALANLTQMAQAIGAAAVIGQGRKGWARRLQAEERHLFELRLTGEPC